MSKGFPFFPECVPYTPFVKAAGTGDFLDVKRRLPFEKSPEDGLLIASLNGQLAIVEYILQYAPGCLNKIQKYTKMCSLNLACLSELGLIEMVKCLLMIETPIIEEAISWTVRTNHVDCLRLLVKAGGDIHRSNDWSVVAAAESNQPETLQYLLDECGLDIHADHDSALERACWYQYPEIIDILLERGADPEKIRGRNTKVLKDRISRRLLVRCWVSSS